MKDFDKIISKISSKDGLTDDESYFSFSYILEGNANEDQIEKFLLGLRERGEKIEEITAATKVMREKSSKVIAPKYWYPNKLTLELDIFRKNWILL